MYIFFFFKIKVKRDLGWSQLINKKAGIEARRLLSIKKPKSWVSNHKRFAGPELVTGRSRKGTGRGGGTSLGLWDLTHYCGFITKQDEIKLTGAEFIQCSNLSFKFCQLVP